MYQESKCTAKKSRVPRIAKPVTLIELRFFVTQVESDTNQKTYSVITKGRNIF